MSVVQIVVPELSESVSEASLIEWKKKVGDPVTQDEILVDIETDKIVLDVPAPASGVLASIQAGNGASVQSGQVIGTIDTSGAAKPATSASETRAPEPAAEPKAPESTAAPAPEPKAAAPAPQPEPAPAPIPKVAPTATAVSAAVPAKEISGQVFKVYKSMPSARRMMANAGLAPDEVSGTGKGGRITKSDVKDAMSQPKAPPVSIEPKKPIVEPAPAPSAYRDEKRVPMSRLRSRVAERLVQSQSEAAILTTFNEVDMAFVIALRNKYKESFEKKYGVKLGFMSFFVKAAVYALQQYPIVNASVEGNDIIYHNYIDIGVAVGSPRGLVVPVLRDADQLTFAEIEMQIADFSKRAANGKLSLEELTGGTFTISNGGVFGSLFSTPIINPPQSAILGIHATKPRPIALDGEVVIRPMNYFALSYDHRIIDGREAVLTLVAIKNALEDPGRLLLDV